MTGLAVSAPMRMKWQPKTGLAILIALCCAACEPQGGSSGRPASEVRDSAGIRIIENAMPPHGSRLAWRTGREPAVSFSVRGHDPYAQHYVSDATRLPDGRIVVAHREAGVRAYDPSGNPLGSWGGYWTSLPGMWIGESRAVAMADGVSLWPGDSLIAWGRAMEGPRTAISVFDTQGNYGRSFALAEDGQSLYPVFTLQRSILAAHATPADAVADTLVLQLHDAEGGLQRPLGSHPGRERYIYAEGTEQEVVFPKILGRYPVAEHWNGVVVVGHTHRYELKAFRMDGSLARIVRRDHVPRPPGRWDVEAFIEMVLADPYYNSRADGSRRLLQSFPVADHLPVLMSVMSDKLGHLWVLEYQTPRETPSPRLWTVFDPDGRALGFVETPAALERVFEIGEDYILGGTGESSPWDPEQVQLWPLERSGGRTLPLLRW